MLFFLALKGLENTLNALIRQDPVSLQKIAGLTGQSIKVEITDWNSSFFILPYSQGIELLNEYCHPPSTTVRGKLAGLIKAGVLRGKTTVLFDESITIEGDTRVGEQFRTILKALSIDWEEQLSGIVGDTLAYPIMNQLKKIARFTQRSVQAAKENLAEYLHYESRLLPLKQSVDSFIEEVSVLRDEVDRLDFRLNRLLARKEG